MRTFQISQGQFVAYDHGGVLPRSIGTCFVQYDRIRFHPDIKTSFAEIRRSFAAQLRPEDQTFYLFPCTATYSPIPYLGSAAAVFLGRHAGLGPLALMYAGRLGNLAIYVWLAAAAIRRLPVLKLPAMLVLASPVPLFLAATLSADGLTTALVFLATAQIADAAFARKLTPTSGCWMAMTLIAVQFAKWAYVPVICFAAAIPSASWGGRKRRMIGMAAVSVLCLLSLLAWIHLTDARHVEMHESSPVAQLHWIVHHPLQYGSVAINTFVRQAPSLCYASMGAMGWQDTLIPSWFVGLHLTVMLLFSIGERKSYIVTRRARVAASTAVILSVGLLVSLIYLGWNKPGDGAIQGIQGRYFIPLYLLCFVIVCSNRVRWTNESMASVWMIICGFACLIVTARRYYF